MNLPNRLTVLRVCMVPVFVVFMLWNGLGSSAKYVAAVIFILASMTDWLDGYLARKNNLVTDFGKFMDPIADKLLVCSAMICLVEKGAPSGLDRNHYYWKRVYHQRISPCGVGQGRRYRGKLLG